MGEEGGGGGSGAGEGGTYYMDLIKKSSTKLRRAHLKNIDVIG